MTIGEGVTSIGENAFKRCKKLTSVTIPKSVICIKKWAFEDSGLKTVTIQGNTTGDYPFTGLYLDNVTFSEDVTIIGEHLFTGSCLKNVTIPDSVTSIENTAFGECSYLNKVTFTRLEPPNVNNAFSNSSSLLNSKGIHVPCSWKGKMNSTNGWGNYETNVTFDHGRTVSFPQTPATCTQDGQNAGEKCTVCGDITEGGEPITATGTHTWSTDYTTDANQHWKTCTVCGAADNKVNHAWGSGEVTTQSTCTTKGVKTYTCACGRKKTEDISAKGHNYTYSANSATAAITEKCSKCNTHTATATLSIDSGVSRTYNGSQIKPAKVIYSNNWAGTGINKSDNSAITYEDNTNVGTAKASITRNLKSG